jgi:hypothetical protein
VVGRVVARKVVSLIGRALWMSGVVGDILVLETVGKGGVCSF